MATVNGSGNLRRELKARHLTMIAIGGSIGTGLFVASGATISQAGPGGALLSYALIGLMVYFLMTSLGELAAYMPVSGSFSTYGAKYVEPGFGFALGWNYWYNWAVTVAVDLVAAQLVVGYWFDSGPFGSPMWVWSAIFLAIIFLINYVSVKGFGEAEYWFSLIKVVTVIIFIGVGTLMIFGIMDGAPNAGWQNWHIGEAPFAGGLSAMIGVAMVVGFSFQGTELIGIAAGESEDPGKNIPRAVRQVFWRILLFYIFAILVISLIIPYTDPSLLNDNEDISISPFTMVFKSAGLSLIINNIEILSAAAIMNAVILTSVLSAGNSGMYASTRMLFALAREGKAPKMFARLSQNGVPRNALFATTFVAGLCFLTSMFGNQQVYLWLLYTSGMTGFIAWLGIAVSHYRFRRGFVAQGRDMNELPYRSSFFPFGPLFAFALCLIIALGQDFQSFLGDDIDWMKVVTTYIGIPLFFLIWFGYKWTKGTKFVKYSEMEFPDKLKGQDQD
ncbi:amino acid permease [Neisseriaceae bacterium CLB008]